MPKIKAKIQNKDAFPGTEWMKPADWMAIGTCGQDSLILVGREPGTNSPVVLRTATEASLQRPVNLPAISLYTLLGQPDKVAVPNPIKWPSKFE